jgi:hypothetical protein
MKGAGDDHAMNFLLGQVEGFCDAQTELSHLHMVAGDLRAHDIHGLGDGGDQFKESGF